MASSPQNAITLSIKSFPQGLLISGQPQKIGLQLINNSNKEEDFRIVFEGENVEIQVPSEFSAEKVRFNPLETKELNLSVLATGDGVGKITASVYWYKTVEYTVKVQKVRVSVPKSTITEILGKYSIEIPEHVDYFNPKDYIVSLPEDKFMELEQQVNLKITKSKNIPAMKQALENRIQGIEPSSVDPIDETLAENDIPDVVLENLDYEIEKLAKVYLGKNNLEKALDLISQISKEEIRQDLYANSIRTANSLDLGGALDAINKIKRKSKKNELIKNLALDRVDIDAEQSGRIAFLIEDPGLKEDLMKDIIAKSINNNPETALKLTYLIDDVIAKVRFLFNIGKKLNQLGKKEDLEDIFAQITNLLSSSDEFDISEGGKNHEVFLDALKVSAEVISPENVDTIIEKIESQSLKETMAKELFDYIYEMVDEVRTKIEPVMSFSTYFILNAFASNINDKVSQFSELGGNISSNIILKDYNFKLTLFSLFSYDFSIFPIIDRTYNDFKHESKNLFGYFLYPSIDNHDEKELETIKALITQFFSGINSASGQVIMFNLDFIPYLGKPTIIIAPDSDLQEFFYKKIQTGLGNNVNLLLDDGMFHGGKTTDNLKAIFSNSQKFKIVNLVLSYEFINDYTIFKRLIELFI